MVALHEPSKHGDDRNYHAHVLMTTRRMEADGLGKKTRELDDQTQGKAEVLHIREYAANLINIALEQTGSDERIDHRSFKDRGIEKIPTKHLSLEALAMEKRGERSDQGDRNREREHTNQTIDALTQERDELDKQIAEARTEKLETAIKTEPIQTSKETYWQDQIKTERKTDSDSGGGTVTPLTVEASREAKNAINNPVNVAHAEQIAAHGEVQHKGLVESWVEHAAEWVYELHDGIIEAWDIFTGTDEPDIPNHHRPNAWERLMGEGEPFHDTEPQERSLGAWEKLMGESKTANNKPSNEPDNDRER